MKLESLVIPNQNVGVNTFPGVVHTARHAMGAGDWGEVVTRYPYENVGMDHLLSMENFIENQPYETFGASAIYCEKVSLKSCGLFT